jgi:phage shock protein A
VSYRELADGFEQQVSDQKAEVESLKSAFSKLEQKLVEARSKVDVLVARHRRARAGRKAGEATLESGNGDAASRFSRMEDRVRREEALDAAYAEITAEGIEDRFAAIEKEGKINALLEEIKARKLLNA